MNFKQFGLAGGSAAGVSVQQTESERESERARERERERERDSSAGCCDIQTNIVLNLPAHWSCRRTAL